MLETLLRKLSISYESFPSRIEKYNSEHTEHHSSFIPPLKKIIQKIMPVFQGILEYNPRAVSAEVSVDGCVCFTGIFDSETNLYLDWWWEEQDYLCLNIFRNKFSVCSFDGDIYTIFYKIDKHLNNIQ